jgi:D-alanine transaminase
VLELAAELGIASEIRTIAAAELASCDEVWIASAGRGVLPLTSIDGRPVGSGKPGPVWHAVYARLQQHLDAIARLPDMEDA